MKKSTLAILHINMVSLMACSAAGSTSETSSRAALDTNFTVSFRELLANARASGPARTAAITALSAKTFSGYAHELLPQVSNATVTIGDVKFTGLRDKLAARDDQFAALDAAYENIGAAWREAGFNPYAALSEAALIDSVHSLLDKPTSATKQNSSLGFIDPYGPQASAIAYGATIGACAAVGVVWCVVAHTCYRRPAAVANGPQDVEMGNVPVAQPVQPVVAAPQRCPQEAHVIVQPDESLMVGLKLSPNVPAAGMVSGGGTSVIVD